MDIDQKILEKVLIRLYDIILFDMHRDIYSNISDYIKELQNEQNILEMDAHKIITNASITLHDLLDKNSSQFKELYSKLEPGMDDEIDSIKTYLKMILYPIVNGYKISGKTQHDFNVDITFFNTMFKNYSNSKIILNEFKFEGSRLIEFSTKNTRHNIMYYYNDDYTQTSIEFLGGDRISISERK